jgi:PAS domain S-box-containing protein
MTTQTAALSSSQAFSSKNKYGGLIQQPIHKRLRNSLFQLNTYLTETCPHMIFMHEVISIFRILQLYGPALLVNFNFWKDRTITKRLLEIFSVFFHLIPPSYREETTTALSFGYVVIIIIIYVLFVASAIYLIKYAKIDRSISLACVIILNTIGILVHPIVFDICGESIGREIAKVSNASLRLRVIEIVLIIIFFIFFLWLFQELFSTSMFCRPTSCFCILGQPQPRLLLLTTFISISAGIAAPTTGIVQIIFCVVSIVLYGLSIVNCLLYGGFLNRIHRILIFTVSVASVLQFIEYLVLKILKVNGSDLMFLVLIAQFFIIFGITYFVLNRRILSFLSQLDKFEANGSLDHIQSEQNYINVAINGFALSHPSVISWQLFDAGIDKWPDSINCWVLFIKFVAIYPEENQLFIRVFNQFINEEIKGPVAKCVISEILSLLQHRETNMSPLMRKKLNHAKKGQWALQNKMRQIWDLVIQGNSTDLPGSITTTYKSLQQMEAEFARLIRQFPNSRFVTRSYARFIFDVYADHVKFQEWTDKTRDLQRGIQVSQDLAQELGFIYFHNIPSYIKRSTSRTGTIVDFGDNSSQNLEIDSELLQDGQIEPLITMRKKMDSLRIEGTANGLIMKMVCYLLFFCVPFAILMALVEPFCKKLIVPLSFMEVVARLRDANFVGNSYAIYHLMVRLHEVNSNYGFQPITELINTEGNPPEYLGASWDVHEQSEFVRSLIPTYVQTVDQIEDFDTSNEKTSECRNLIFGNNFVYIFFSSIEKGSEASYNKTINLKSAFVQMNLDFSMMFSMDLSEYATETPNSAKNPIRHISVMNCLDNIEDVSQRCDDVLVTLAEYIVSESKKYANVYKVVMVILCIITPFLIGFETYIELKMVISSRNSIYKCLMTMPKNIISKISDSLKSIKKETTELTNASETSVETNKQEENVLKVLSTSDNGFQVADQLEYIVFAIFAIILSVIISYLLCDMYIISCDNISAVAPHVNYLMGAFGYQIGAYLNAVLILLKTQNIEVDFMTYDRLLNVFYQRLDTSGIYFDYARYGLADGHNPFEEFKVEIEKAVSKMSCSQSDQALPEAWDDVYRCLSPDLLFATAENILKSIVEPVRQDLDEAHEHSDYVIPFSHSAMNYLWDMEFYYCFNKLFAPIFENMMSDVLNELDIKKAPLIIAASVLLVVALIVTGFQLMIIKQSEKEMRFALEMLLLCQPTPLMQNTALSSVLSGNFRMKIIDEAAHTEEYFRKIIEDIPDSIIMGGPDGKINYLNKSALRLFDDHKDELIGMRFSQFFGESYFMGSLEELRKPPPVEAEGKYRDKKGDIFYLSVSSTIISESTSVTIRNITQAVVYKNLIHEEKIKSDQMLNSILPPKLVTRVQKGEKNISFSVQSATITFMDIVEFTPWCAANTPQVIMSTLNRLFKEWDAICSSKPTMTKVKCIGDCYMAAGGLFSEVNQPAEHAKEVVEFGIGAIKAVEMVDEELGLDRRIRVGINTGGPLVGGVLGSGKPTFEIIGPVINVAQQMEHHGVPMQVHISRSTYELIYGGNFKVKERGQIEIKQGNVVTYLVNPE